MKNLIRKATVFALSGALLLTALLASGCGTSIAERREDTSSTLYVGEVSTDSFPTTFFPWQSRDGIAPTIASLIYNTLFTLDEETGEYEPCLAKEWCYTDLSGTPLVDENGKNDYDKIEQYYTQNDSDYMVVKLMLFEGATWSDGQPVTVEDVYYTLDIATDNALSGHAGALAWTNDLEHRSEGGVLQKQGMYTAARDEWGKYPYAALMQSMLIFAVFPVLALFAQPLGSISCWFPIIIIGIAGAAHQSWSANLYSVGSDMFPKNAMATITGINGMAGGVSSFLINMGSGMLFDYAAKTHLTFMGFEGKEAGYFIIFCICAVAYLLAWCVMKAFVPKYKLVKL